MNVHKDQWSSFKISAMQAMFLCILVIVCLSLLCPSWNRLSPFWKCVVPTKHCSTMYKTFWIISNVSVALKPAFQLKQIAARCSIVFSVTIYGKDKTDKLTLCREYLPRCERVELKFGVHGEKGLLTNFPSFMEIALLVLGFRSVVEKLNGQTLYVPCRFVRWRCVALRAQAQNLCGNPCIWSAPSKLPKGTDSLEYPYSVPNQM